MRSAFLSLVGGALLTLVLGDASLTEYASLDTVGLVRLANGTYKSAYSTWNYPGGGFYYDGDTSADVWFTQYISLDRIPQGPPGPASFGILSETSNFSNVCPNYIQVGTNITVNPNTGASSGSAFYRIDNVTTPITLANGTPYVFSSGDSISATINVTSVTEFEVALGTSNSGTLKFSVEAKTPLCLKHVQWSLGYGLDILGPGFSDDFYIYNAQAEEVHEDGSVLQVGGTNAQRQALLQQDELHADTGEVTDGYFSIEYDPDCIYG